MKTTLLTLIAVFLLGTNTVCAEPEKIKFWLTDVSPPRAQFESELTKLVLKKSEGEFGPFELEFVLTPMSYGRARRALADGHTINALTNPLPAKLIDADKHISVLTIPVMQGLLGYRSLLTHKSNLARFKDVKTLDDLKKLKAGQVDFWADVPMYTSNKLPLAQASSMDVLFNMLSRNRFDYLPLGIFEHTQILAQYKDLYPDIVSVPNIVLYYPFPVYFHISDNAPNLFERFELGIHKAQADGSLKKLFASHFQTGIKDIAQQTQTVIFIPNPKIPKSIEFENLLHPPKSAK